MDGIDMVGVLPSVMEGGVAPTDTISIRGATFGEVPDDQSYNDPNVVPEDVETIVVVGRKITENAPTGNLAVGGSVSWYDGQYAFSNAENALEALPDTDTAIDITLNPYADDQVIEVKVDIDRPLTALEIDTLNRFVAEIKRIDEAIKSLPSHKQIRMNDGSIITAAELKQFWAITDFTIKSNDTGLTNGGGAFWNGGNPVVAFNVETFPLWNLASSAALNYLILHELGHFTALNRGMWDNLEFRNSPTGLITIQENANDVARALANEADMPLYPEDPGRVDYSTDLPILFVEPQSYEVGDDNGGGGGGGGRSDDEPLRSFLQMDAIA